MRYSNSATPESFSWSPQVIILQAPVRAFFVGTLFSRIDVSIYCKTYRYLGAWDYDSSFYKLWESGVVEYRVWDSLTVGEAPAKLGVYLFRFSEGKSSK